MKLQKPVKMLLATFMTVFLSCDKSEHGPPIYGTVVEAKTGLIMPGTDVMLKYWSDYSNDIHIMTTVTNWKGEFYFDRKAKKSLNRVIIADNATHIGKILHVYKAGPHHVMLDPESWLAVKVKKNTSAPAGIYLNAKSDNSTYIYSTISKPGPFDTLIGYLTVPAETEITLKWDITKVLPQPSTTNSLVTLSIQKFDTLIYIIQYD